MPLCRTSLILIEAKVWSVNEKVNLWIQNTNLHKDVIKVLAMLESKSTPIKFEHGLLEGWARTTGIGAQTKLVHTFCRAKFGL